MEIAGNIPGKGFAKIYVTGDRIGSVQLMGPVDPRSAFISPGFIDLQLNGFAGIDFSADKLDAHRVAAVLPAVWKTGVTTFCPTVITNSRESLLETFRVLEEARRLDACFARSAPCYHLEGPYISQGPSRGAHDPRYMRPPAWEEFCELQRAAGGSIGIVTLAPELPGAIEFIRRARDSGVIVALGHTDAHPEQIHNAVDAGSTLSTHLGNGNPQTIDRHANTLWPQMAEDRLAASLICDGFHLPEDLVRVISRVKGIDRCILITDAVHVAGLPAGRYSLVGMEIELLPTGKVVMADRRCMAGSALSMDRAVAIFKQFATVSLEEAVQAATANPARLLGRFDLCSEVAEGQMANLTCFRLDNHVIEIETTILAGQAVYPGGLCSS